MNSSQNDKSGTTWTPEIKYQHNGPIWRIEAGGAYSHAGNDYRADEKGFFSGVNMTLRAPNPAGALVTPAVRLDYTQDFLPEVTAFYADGRVTDPHDYAQYSLDNATALDRKSNDIKKTLRMNIERRTDFLLPMRVRFGGDIRESVRDIRETTPAYTFVGPDGRANTADNMAGLYDIFDERFSSVDPVFGQSSYRWMDVYKVYDLYKAHPDWWTSDPAAVHANLVNTSKNITETVTSGFIRLDTAFFRNRLLLAGGWRFQEYKVHSESGEVNTLGRYLTDEDGELVLDANNRPVPLPGNALDVAQNTNVERGIVRKSRMKGFYPSVNAIVRLTDDLQFRTSFANSINYPQLSEILAVTTVSDYTANPRRLVVNKPLKPWLAHNYDVELEYFTPDGGSVSVGWWRKEMTGFITTATYRGTDALEALERNGYGVLAPLGYEVQEKFNAGEAKMEGWEAALHQSLNSYLPEWGRGLTVFFNTSYKASHRGTGAAGLDAVSRRSINWGASYRRGRFSTTLKWNHVPEPKRATPSATATHPMSRTYTDADVSFRLTRRLSLFASGTNIFAVPVETFVYTDDTPEYARRTAHRHFGVQCVAGIKGQF
jgi:TonB-dependent receptor